eukprot:CAMPEP_0168220258 /NCGR_PEP_ID=MMETSP0140_2-20121125/9113_1 /TAXON_ID=44445 /ORGANISM="Pseudo-nitzschia australis, Strain 10249 10 AB" /LENGTH=200 /DNA_ID=CAMNT_0008148925 /DNA_START=352 /DNA_END=956 /DNA_ORIENTATION=-
MTSFPPSTTGTPHQLQPEREPERKLTMAMSIVKYRPMDRCDPSNHLRIKLTTMMIGASNNNNTLSEGPPSLQVRPEHHSNYNGTCTDDGNGNSVVLINIQLRPKQPAALANEIHDHDNWGPATAATTTTPCRSDIIISNNTHQPFNNADDGEEEESDVGNGVDSGCGVDNGVDRGRADVVVDDADKISARDVLAFQVLLL